MAVLTVRQCWPRRSRWARHVVFVAALPAGVAVFAAPLAAAVVASAVADAAGWHLVARALLVSAPVMFVLLVAATIGGNLSGLRCGAGRGRRLACGWARDNGVTLMEASLLVARTGDCRAATVLVRRLLATPTATASPLSRVRVMTGSRRCTRCSSSTRSPAPAGGCCCGYHAKTADRRGPPSPLPLALVARDGRAGFVGFREELASRGTFPSASARRTVGSCMR